MPRFLPECSLAQGGSQNDFINFEIISGRLKEVRIYNRWGNLIRHLDVNIRVWDGSMDNGNIASEGVYYYVLGFDGLVEGLHNHSGYIHLFL